MGLGRSVQGFGFIKFTRNQIEKTLKLPGLAKKILRNRNPEYPKSPKKSKKFKTFKTDEI